MRQGQPTTQANKNLSNADPMNIAGINTAGDVVAFLKSQHEVIKATFEKVLAAKSTDRQPLFLDLQKLLTIHEAAEEKIVHPAAKSAIDHGDAIVNARIKEETEAKLTLASLAKLEVTSPEFETKLRAFQQAVLKHAKAEETEEFNRLETTVDPTRLKQMKDAAIQAEKDASSIKN